MDKLNYTITIASNSQSLPKTLSVSHGTLKLMGWTSALLFSLAGAAIVDSFGLRNEPALTTKLQTENQALKLKMRNIGHQIKLAETELNQVKVQYKKMAIVTEQTTGAPLEKSTQLSPTQIFQDLKIPVSGELGFTSFTNEAPLKVTAIDQQWNKKDWPSRIDVLSNESRKMKHQILKLWDTVNAHQSLILATPNIKPVNGWYTSRFGYRLDPFTNYPQMHAGLDIATPYGRTVVATAPGLVTFSGYQAGYGHIVQIDHGYGMQTRYAHNSKVYVEKGESVRRGQRIAATGNSGRVSGTHLHYEVRIKGIPVDPANYILK